VDWGNFGAIQIGAVRRVLSCFVLVLSWSRAVYARFALDQTLESFLRGHVEAFAALGGIPRVLLYDNLKSVVLERFGEHIRFHPRLLELAGHYHFAPQPCAVARGNEKGRVERMIQYLRHAFFAARRFTTVDDLNAQLAAWIADTAHARPVPSDPTGRRVAEALDEERPRLLPLPAHPFACDLVRGVSSGKIPYLRFDSNDSLKLLGLHHTAEHLDDLVALATKRRWSPTQLLEHLADVEQQERARRSLERRLLRSRLGRITPMVAFDWAWPTRIDRAAVEAALRLDFLAAGRNCVLVAAQGLGKTMIAQNIAHQAVLAGHHVLFTTAAQLLLDLGSQESARGLARRLNLYGQRGLLVLDELGYLSYDARAADLLFQVVSRRYERKSLVLTTNLAFSDWPTIFPNAGSAIALIDRLIHHAEIIAIEGESYRRRAAEAARTAPRSKPTS
jgi:DNA replication protein DnaC